jgi:hypothetical protein
MIDPNDPPRGSMYLYDAITPAAKDGVYKATVASVVTYPVDVPPPPPLPPPAPQTQTLGLDRYFEIAGPRFSLQATDVANVYPPRNSVGAFHDALPQIVIKRRTLPWERPLGTLAATKRAAGDPPPPDGDVPWVALLLFAEGEYTLYQGLPLDQAVPAAVFQRLGRPANIRCDAVEADAGLIASILPAAEELQLLAHVRQVNVEDRELNADSSDGFFSVVISNRLPSPGLKHRACLVSLEQRTDLVSPDPPPFTFPSSLTGQVEGGVLTEIDDVAVREAIAAPAAVLHAPVLEQATASSVRDRFIPFNPVLHGSVNLPLRNLARLVVLQTWQFTCTTGGTFFEIMQALDVGMVGKVAAPGHPPLLDTGHLQLPLQDRAGVPETAWYRGPLVPWELTRDPLGPYHSADQARRATPETGAEDVSYAAAFEVGRLLAAADPRLAQELMRWRRESYRQAARADGLAAIARAIDVQLPADLAERLHTVLTPRLATAAVERVVANAGPIVDRLGLTAATRTVGMDPQSLSTAWGLASPLAAQQILSGNASALGASVAAPAQTPRQNTTLEEVAADAGALDHLTASRARLLENTTVKLSVAAVPAAASGGGKTA